MMSIVNTVIVFCALGQFGAKAELRIYYENVSMALIDPMYFDVENTEYYLGESTTGESTITTKLSIITELPVEMEGNYKLWGLSMGKYDHPTGIDLTMKICEMFEEPVMFGRFLTIMGFSADVCPPTPGVYFHEGYVLPVNEVPDDFPKNKYLGVFEISFEGKPALVTHNYMEIH